MKAEVVDTHSRSTHEGCGGFLRRLSYLPVDNKALKRLNAFYCEKCKEIVSGGVQK